MKLVIAALVGGMAVLASLLPVSAADDTKYRETVLYSFCSQPNCADGLGPAALIDVKGTLYGTTVGGGIAGCGGYGCGTVFSLDPKTGGEKVLYGFCGQPNCADGEFPNGGLIDVKSTLYGTTNEGGSGANGAGTAFAVDPNTGAEKVLHAFCSQEDCTDGSYPGSGPINVKGTLYGTTPTGGNGNDSENGTAFALNPTTGVETILYDFCSLENCADGEQPQGALVEMKGTLYGTTSAGGTYGCGDGQACGTVFSLDPTNGAETVLHSFGNGVDGKSPEAGVIALNGMLYGTTDAGGVTGCGSYGCGTVFSVNLNTGTEKVLYSFCSQQNCADGASPDSSMISVKGMLYGTTPIGGGSGCNGSGCGTVFSIDPNTGAEKVLYAFCGQKNCTDGAYPYGLIAVKDTLYGTTSAGGMHGDGTVFSLTRR